MKSPLKKTGRHGRIRALTREHLNQLAAEDLKRLAEFADRRLGSLPRSRFTADDAVQKALLSIVLGTVKADAGR
jgi:DNA-directed RNA polymerase specialized sigma24 family protein